MNFMEESDIQDLKVARLFRSRRRSRDWVIIISIAVLAHLAVFIFLKPSYLEIFRNEPPGDDGNSQFRFIEQPYASDPNPDYSPAVPEVTDPVNVVEDENKIQSFLDDLGEPAIDVAPVNVGRRGGGSDGRAGPRRTTVEPKPLFMPWPKYPEGVDRDINGKVELLLYVDEKGKVREIKLSRGLPSKLLNDAAMEAAADIRFIPGEVKGVPTAMWIRLTIGFQPR